MEALCLRSPRGIPVREASRLLVFRDYTFRRFTFRRFTFRRFTFRRFTFRRFTSP
jgi:hypothetical protein